MTDFITEIKKKSVEVKKSHKAKASLFCYQDKLTVRKPTSTNLNQSQVTIAEQNEAEYNAKTIHKADNYSMLKSNSCTIVLSESCYGKDKEIKNGYSLDKDKLISLTNKMNPLMQNREI